MGRRSGTIFIGIILVQIVVAAGLALFLILKANSHPVYVNQVLGESIVHNPESNLKYFFEPVPNSMSVTDPVNKWSTAKFRRNKDGLNDRFDYAPEKDSSTYRIITLGDSFTAGLSVDVSQNFSEVLEDRLNAEQKCPNIKKFEVINLGVSGYDIQYAVERFRLRGQKYNPDMVIWLLKYDDFYEINEIEKQYEQDIISQMKKSGEWDKQLNQGKLYPQADKISSLMDKTHAELGDKKLLDMQIKYLHSIRQYFKGKLVLATFPYNYDVYRKVMENFSNEDKSVFYTDKLINLNQHKELTFYPYDGHPNQLGHQEIANDLLNFLTEKKLIPCL